MMPRPAADPVRRIVEGRHVLLALIGFFSLVMAVNGLLTYTAISTFGGVDNPNAYRDGLSYNERIAADERQSELGWRHDVAVSADRARLSVSVFDREGAPLAGLRISASIGRPVTNRHDAVLALEEIRPGAYEAETPDLGAGSWIVEIRAVGRGDSAVYRARKRLWLKP
ncbi:MAG TPA: FixH family protein [Hyphomicrobiaceae bacterium]|nr:FixH family protein [Hyphomicrobiaceae bacterium]